MYIYKYLARCRDKEYKFIGTLQDVEKKGCTFIGILREVEKKGVNL